MRWWIDFFKHFMNAYGNIAIYFDKKSNIYNFIQSGLLPKIIELQSLIYIQCRHLNRVYKKIINGLNYTSIIRCWLDYKAVQINYIQSYIFVRFFHKKLAWVHVNLAHHNVIINSGVRYKNNSTWTYSLDTFFLFYKGDCNKNIGFWFIVYCEICHIKMIGLLTSSEILRFCFTWDEIATCRCSFNFNL